MKRDPMPWEFATLRDRLFGSFFVGCGVTMAAFSLVALSCAGAGQVEQNDVFSAALPYTLGIGALVFLVGAMRSIAAANRPTPEKVREGGMEER